MHASLSLSDESLQKISKKIDGNPIHIHIAESFIDEKQSMEKYGKSIISRLDGFGLLNENSLLAHCLYINKEEAEIIVKRNCKVVFNTISNMNNGVGLPDYELMKHTGIETIIGNDGIAAGITGDWQNLYYSMHLRYNSSTAFGLEELRNCINNGYNYASNILGCNLGRIKEGYEADLLMISYVPPTPININNIMGHLFFGMFSDFKPKYVWCEGQQIVTDYEMSDIMKINYKNAKISAAELWRRIEKG
jgi:cytosine/adenosine deaminase-related metal-dependent hydrolase